MLSIFQRNKIRRAKPPEEENTGEINVVPFLDIITNVMMFVLATVAVTFTATIETSAPKAGPRPPATNDVGLAVPKKEGAYDYDALKSCATRLKSSSPNESDVTISANPQVPYDVVIAT